MPRDRVALVVFDAEARVALGLSGDEQEVGRALDALTTGSGTRIDLGLAKAAELVADQARSEAALAVILLTDGLHAGDVADVIEAADTLKRSKSWVFTIGLGSEVDEAMLRAIASSPERYLHSPTAAELRALYARILLQIDCDTALVGSP
jgi:Mg-chelatase subunit ChlD